MKLNLQYIQDKWNNCSTSDKKALLFLGAFLCIWSSVSYVIMPFISSQAALQADIRDKKEQYESLITTVSHLLKWNAEIPPEHFLSQGGSLLAFLQRSLKEHHLDETLEEISQVGKLSDHTVHIQWSELSFNAWVRWVGGLMNDGLYVESASIEKGKNIGQARIGCIIKKISDLQQQSNNNDQD